jgi:hypothetical protein
MTKQIYDLDENDIRKFKIWEFLSENHKDADDEATVMAHEKAPEKEPSSIYIHHAVFTANDGTTFNGYVYAGNTDDLSNLQPVIITKMGQVHFWDGIVRPTEKELMKRYSITAKTSKELFPINWVCIMSPRIRTISKGGLK